jgi:hypothetical protein
MCHYTPRGAATTRSEAERDTTTSRDQRQTTRRYASKASVTASFYNMKATELRVHCPSAPVAVVATRGLPPLGWYDQLSAGVASARLVRRIGQSSYC